MGKGRDSRRARRRDRAKAPKLPEPAPTPLDRERVRARFRHLAGRDVELGFLAWGPVVNADTPEELVERVESALVAECGRQRPS